MAKSGKYSRSIFASDEVKDIYCEPCQIDSLLVIAEGYCVDCSEYLCGQCCKSHRRNKMSFYHVLLDNDKMPIDSASITTVLDVCKEKCTSHPNKVIELFCVNCNKVGCYICVSIDHRQCKKVQHIPDIAKHKRTTLNEQVKSSADNLSKYEEMLQAKINYNKKISKLAKQELKHQRDEINKFFDQLEKKMNEKVASIEKRNNCALKVVSDKMDQIKIEFDQIKDDIEGMRKGQNCGQFIAMMQHQEKMTALNYQFGDMVSELNKLTVQCYKLFPSEQILSMIQAMIETKTELCRMATASFETQINMPSSNHIGITCLTIVQGYLCVVVRNNYSKYSIKVIDTKSKLVTSETNIEAENITSITLVSKDQVALSVLPSTEQLRSLERKMLPENLHNTKEQILFSTITVSASGVIEPFEHLIQCYVTGSYIDMVNCKGIIYGIFSSTEHFRFYTTNKVKHNRIDVLSMTGEIMRTIQTDDNGADLFGTPQGIAVSPDEQTLYVTDIEKNCVTSLTLDGKVKAVYTDKDLCNPQGVTVDKYGYVYVHNKGKQSIHQLTADLKMFQVLLENHIPGYYGSGNYMTYSSTEHKLYINDGYHINQYSLD